MCDYYSDVSNIRIRKIANKIMLMRMFEKNIQNQEEKYIEVNRCRETIFFLEIAKQI